MKRLDVHPTLGPLVAMACRCSVWPVAALVRRGRCGQCGVSPLPIPPYEELNG